MKKLPALSLVSALIVLSACGSEPSERALSGAGIGAGIGAVGGALISSDPITGALIGGAVGAVTGAVTTEDEIDLNKVRRRP